MRSLMRKLACLALLLGAMPALHAQLDTRFATKTDLLDVYKPSNPKPEVATIFDFSNSTHSLIPHPKYFTDKAQKQNLPPSSSSTLPNWRGKVGSDGDWPGVVPVINKFGDVAFYKGSGMHDDVTHSTVVIPYGGRLVHPDGTLEPFNGTTTYTQAQLTDMVKRCSHVRITLTVTDLTIGTTTYASITRTVDLPIPWTIFQRVSNPSADAIHYKVTDPYDSSTVEPDQTYASTALNNIVNRDPNADTAKPNAKIGRAHLAWDYLWWIFFGTTVKAGNSHTTWTSTDTGKFVIPAVYSSHPALEPNTPASPAATVWNEGVTWANDIPAMSRLQALRRAVVETWLANQTKMLWAFRFLDKTNEDNTTTPLNANNGSATATTVSRDLRRFEPGDPNGTLRNFTQVEPVSGTPSAHALANIYAQLTVLPETASIFPTDGDAACRKTYVVLFTDGWADDNPTNGSDDDYSATRWWPKPYLTTGSETAGNAALAGHISWLAPGVTSGTGQNYFNIYTLAAIAAHYNDPITGVLGNYAPFKIVNRGATATNPRRIRTMTVALGLPGYGGDPAPAPSGVTNYAKWDLYRAALYGNPDVKSWDATNTLPFDPDNPAANNPAVNPFYFDGDDPDKLIRSLNLIAAEAIRATGSIAAPAVPMVGLNLGREAYFGSFGTPDGGGPRWFGDLIAAGIRVNGSGVIFVDNAGTPITTLTAANALWSATNQLRTARSWKPTASNGRKIYTSLDDATLTRVDDSSSAFTDAMLGASSATERQQLLRFILGADETAMVDGTSSGMRSDPIGAILFSAPAVVQFPIDKITASTSPTLSAWLSGLGATATNKLFRVIVVADNQGYLHFFGEASASVGGIQKAAVDEICAFVPRQCLKSYKYLRNASNSFIYMFDGSPRIYHRDEPASGQASGNGIVDESDVLRIVVGMGKADRRYFAFSFAGNDPFQPVLSWVLDPAASTDAVVQKMGLATAQPAFGRVETSSGVTKDLCFLGGGYSDANIESSAQFGIALGRNVIAVDVQTGAVVKTWDLASAGFSDVGPISAGVVPFEFVAGSNRTQRLYFADQPITSSRGSAVWAIGTTSTNTNGLRLDSSNIDLWTATGTTAGAMGLRKVYQADAGEVISTLPSPFNLAGPYPVPRTATPIMSVPAVGILTGTGNRWDPRDRDTIDPAGSGGSGFNRFVCVFDRNDSGILSTNTPSVSSADTDGLKNMNLTNLTDVSLLTDTKIDPSNLNYYLKTSYGYYLSFSPGSVTPKTATDGSAYNFPKMVNRPITIDGVGFFTVYSAHNSGVGCGVTGASDTYRLCNVLAPVFQSGTAMVGSANTFNATSASCSGKLSTWVNIPSEITAVGSVGIVQAGQSAAGGGGGSSGSANIQVQGGSGHVNEGGFRAKLWRSVR